MLSARGCFDRAGCVALVMLLVAMVGAPVSLAQATTWIVPDAETLSDQSDVIVLASVDSLRSVRSLDGSRITTEVIVDVIEGYKGARAGDRLVIHETGGHVGRDTQWVFGSPEYRQGELALLYLEHTAVGALRTLHLGVGKLDAEIRADGTVRLSGPMTHRQGGPQLLSEVERGIRRQSPPDVPSPLRLRPSAPRLEGPSQALSAFRLMDPASRWAAGVVSFWGDLVGDSALGHAASRDSVIGAAAAWHAQPGSSLETQYAGDRVGPGLVCNPGYTSVSFNDPLDQVGDPVGCGGGALAVAGFCSSSVGNDASGYRTITSGAVVVNDGWSGCWFWNQANLAEILTHEVGHTLGFAHSWDSYLGSTSDPFVIDATMYWMAHFDGRGAGLRDYDRGAVAFLYDGDPDPIPDPLDPDGDGVVDPSDNCPTTANPQQSDADLDGIGDACDACPDFSGAANCRPLDPRVRLTHKNTSAEATLRVRARTAYTEQLNRADDVTVTLEGTDNSWTITLPSELADLSATGESLRFDDGETRVVIRRKPSRTTVTVRSSRLDPALSALVGEDTLRVRVDLGEEQLAGITSCATKDSAKKSRTTCQATAG